jgi:hypothetical protein
MQCGHTLHFYSASHLHPQTLDIYLIIIELSSELDKMKITNILILKKHCFTLAEYICRAYNLMQVSVFVGNNRS